MVILFPAKESPRQTDNLRRFSLLCFEAECVVGTFWSLISAIRGVLGTAVCRSMGRHFIDYWTTCSSPKTHVATNTPYLAQFRFSTIDLS